MVQVSLVANTSQYAYLLSFEGTDMNELERYLASMKKVGKILKANLKTAAINEILEKGNRSVNLSFIIGKNGKIKAFQVKEEGFLNLKKQLISLITYLPNNWKPKIGKSGPEDFDMEAFLAFTGKEDNMQLGLYGYPPPPPKIMGPEETEVFKVVENIPSFPGCEAIKKDELRLQCTKEQMIGFVNTHMRVPKAAIRNQAKGVVIVQLIVAENASSPIVKIVKDMGYGVGTEVKRVLNLLTINEREGGHFKTAVLARYDISLVFDFENHKKK
jgi:hypothetical protein